MKTERTKNSIYNSIAGLANNIFVTILSFVVRTIFIKELGKQCLGIDGLFLNILSLLSLTELGFSTAVGFSLYKPLAENDTKKINQTVIYLKKVYRAVAIVIFVLGLAVMPFLKDMAKGYTVSYNIYLIYILYLFNTVFSYLTSYSLTLLEADQKGYKTIFIKTLFNIIVYGLQIVILIFTKNFILYLIVQLLFRQLERLITHLYIKSKYKNVDFSSKDTLSKEESKKIKRNIKDILLHKIGGYAVSSTDNILISSIINISMTGIYSNYLSIISILRNLLGSVIYGSMASFGNINVTERAQIKKNVFEVINFVCYFIAGFLTVGIYFCINPFITWWVGEKYLLSYTCLVIICINFYLDTLLIPTVTVKNTSGLYHVDRYVQIIRAIINLAISIILGIKIGIIGILLGTCISSILTVNIVTPFVIYKHIFKDSSIVYFKKIFLNIINILLSILISSYLFNLVIFENIIIKLIVYGSISVIIYFVIFVLLNFSSKEFKYIWNMIKNFFKKTQKA